jgi:hypothetical protein
MPYPHPPDGGLWIARVMVHEFAGPVIRGYLRGLWCPLHNTDFAQDRDTFAGVGPLSGRSFMCLRFFGAGTGTSGIAVLETSDTWDTN